MLPSTSLAFASQLSKRLASQPNARILLSRALVAAHPISGGSSCSSSCSPEPHQRRCLSAHALTCAPATRGSCSKDNVKPWLRQYRPQVNGRTVAFHVNDLLKQQSQSASPTPVSSSPSQQQTNKREYESDLVVILDMDECMIHSQFLSSPQNAQVYAHQLQNQRRLQGSGSSAQVDHFRISLESGDLVHVNVRPGLMEFLDQVTSRYETHVFTAAMSVYARPVLDQLDPNGTKFSKVWYREHCRFDAQRNAYLKDLEALPELDPTKLGRTVLVDNNPLSFLTHPQNGILVSSFYNDAQDNTLPAVWNLLQELEQHEGDVRPVLDARFGLENALAGQQQQQAEKAKAATTTAPPVVPIEQAAATASQQQVCAV